MKLVCAVCGDWLVSNPLCLNLPVHCAVIYVTVHIYVNSLLIVYEGCSESNLM
jgi:hypothetical protein